MERFDIGRDDRLARMVDAVERGEPVEIVRDGEVVAQVVVPALPAPSTRRTTPFDPAEWEALHRMLPASMLGGDMAAELRALRDMD